MNFTPLAQALLSSYCLNNPFSIMFSSPIIIYLNDFMVDFFLQALFENSSECVSLMYFLK